MVAECVLEGELAGLTVLIEEGITVAGPGWLQLVRKIIRMVSVNSFFIDEISFLLVSTTPIIFNIFNRG